MTTRRERRVAERAARRRKTARAAAGVGAVLVSFGGAAYVVAAQVEGDGASVEAAAVPVRLLSTELDVGTVDGGGLALFDDAGEQTSTSTATPEPVTSSTSTTSPATSTTAAPTTTTTERPAAPAPLLEIGRYSYSKPLHAGATPEAVAAGPAWHPASAAVGAPGRAVVAVPFNLAGVRPGDVVDVELQSWKVARVGVFDPADATVLFGDPGRPELVLYQSLPAEGGQPFIIALIHEETQP